MVNRKWNNQRGRHGASWRARLALVLALVLTIAGSAGLALPGGATIANVAEAATASQSNSQATVSIVGRDDRGNNTYFLAPTNVSLAGSANGWDVLTALSKAAGIRVDAKDTSYGKYIQGITNPLTGSSLTEDIRKTGTSSAWFVYVNGTLSSVGISSLNLHAGDSLALYFGTYDSEHYSNPVLPAASSVKTQSRPMYRLYNPNSGEHFYTADKGERDATIRAGWHDEGTGWIAPVGGNPVYRLYNPNAGEHHYTLAIEERDALIRAGWKDEGIGWFSDPQKAVPLYREYNPNQIACNHNFTTSREEHNYLVSLGWRDEGIAWYGVN